MKDKIVIQRKYTEIYFDRLGHPFYGYRALLVEQDGETVMIGNPYDEENRLKVIVPNDRLGHHIEYALETGALQIGDDVLIRCTEERPAKWNFQFSLLTPMFNGFIVAFINDEDLVRPFDESQLTF